RHPDEAPPESLRAVAGRIRVEDECHDLAVPRVDTSEEWVEDRMVGADRLAEPSRAERKDELASVLVYVRGIALEHSETSGVRKCDGGLVRPVRDARNVDD